MKKIVIRYNTLLRVNAAYERKKRKIKKTVDKFEEL